MVIPEEASQTLPILERCFGSSLVAVYLYGSAVTGGLRPNSDVDLMAIIDQPTTPETRKNLAAELMRVSGRYPPRSGDPRPLELIVFQRASLISSAYPASCEFLYGEWLRAEIEAGVVPEPQVNPDFSLALAQARLEAKTLFGPPPANLLPAIPGADIRRAIGDGLPGLLDFLEGDERNVLLTLARMWLTLATGEFVPKDVAADWAIARLPAQGAALLSLARDAYLGTKDDGDWQVRQREAALLAGELSERVKGAL